MSENITTEELKKSFATLNEVRDQLQQSHFPLTVELILDSALAPSYRKSVDASKIAV